MADAPSFRISTRSTASNGIVDRSVNIFWKSSARGYGARRRPFTKTNVALAPKPRREIAVAPAAKPLPKPVGSEPCPSRASDCRYSVKVAFPELAISSFVIVWTGFAPSVSVRRMFEPVTSTRCSSCAPLCCAYTAPPPVSAAVLLNARSKLLDSMVLLSIGTPEGRLIQR